jgi:hypothetical protein
MDPKDVWDRAQAVTKKTGMIASYSECGKEWWLAYAKQMMTLRVLTKHDSFMQTFVAADGYSST